MERGSAQNQASSLIVHSEEPFNAETPLQLISGNYITPASLFFIRNHGDVPAIDLKQYRLRVKGLVRHPLDLSLHDIVDGFPSMTVGATLQCAGNRRSGLTDVAPIPGEIAWDAGAIGNAEWTGVPLSRILEETGLDERAAHVAFSGLDTVEHGFGASIPITKARSPEVILAYQMNGEPLTPMHGFPLRVIVPGYIGARSVKWLGEITVQASPSSNFFQSHAYRLFPPDARAGTVTPDDGFPLTEMPVNAAITSPSEGEILKAGRFLVRGYAIAGGRRIERVDLTSNHGEMWAKADLVEARNEWSWCHWQKEIHLEPGRAHLSVRAWDSAAQTQPEDPRTIWNLKGYVNNSWHRVNFRVDF